MNSNLSDLRKVCENNKNYKEILLIIENLLYRQDYAKYHYQEYLKLSFIKNDLDAVNLMFEMKQDYYQRRISIEANIMATVQNIHIVHDILGYLIYKTLDLNIKNNNIFLHTIKNHLTDIKDYKYNNLLNLLEKFMDNNSPYSYLCDLINHSKHKYTIQPICRSTITKTIERTYYFDKFTHKKNNHEKMDINYLINTEYNREAKLIIEIKNELIKILKGME